MHLFLQFLQFLHNSCISSTVATIGYVVMWSWYYYIDTHTESQQKSHPNNLSENLTLLWSKV